MFESVRQNTIIYEIRKAIKEGGFVQYLKLNNIREKAAQMVWKGKLDTEFYRNVFVGGTISKHWSEVNKDYIMNFRK